MGRESTRLASICPADVIAHSQAVSEADYKLFDAFPGEFGKLETAIAQAVTALLPDELIVHEGARIDLDADRMTPFWYVLQSLDPATKRAGQGGMEDDATHSLQDAIEWLSDLDRVAESIGLNSLIREAVRSAELALDADA